MRRPSRRLGRCWSGFTTRRGCTGIWEKHRPNYAALVERYHVPLAKMVFDTDIYLKLQSGGYLGRTFTIYLDFLGDPNQANARNYGADYYVVVFPSPDPASKTPLKMDRRSGMRICTTCWIRWRRSISVRSSALSRCCNR